MYMLFAGREVRIVKTCDRGLERVARVRSILTDPKSVNNLFTFFPSSETKKHSREKKKKTHASVTVIVVRDRKIWTALTTNQIVGFVTVPAWKKINRDVCPRHYLFREANSFPRATLLENCDLRGTDNV